MSQHAFLAPSAAARWVQCPGSARMEAQYPEQGDQQAAREGIAAHWVMEFLMSDVLNMAKPCIGGQTPNGVYITREIWESGETIFEDVVNTLGPNWRSMAIVERRVNIPRVHPSLNWGTPDVRAWTAAGDRRTLRVWDLKHGHKHVDVYENWQLLDYAAGCMTEANEWAQANGQPAFPETHVDIVLRVVQPRSYHRDGPIREWRLTAEELRSYVFRLSMAADEAAGDNPPLKPHPDACENCSARHACPALQAAAYRAVDISMQAQALDLPPAALGLEARLLTDARALLDARLSGLEEQIRSNYRNGVNVPHWTLVPGSARVKWSKPDAEVLLLGEVMGASLAKTPEPITPTQAQTKGIDPEFIKAYSFTPPGAMKLIVDDGSIARRTFTKL